MNSKIVIQKALQELQELKAKEQKPETNSYEKIAIVSAGCRFPGNIDSLASFWKSLSEGHDAISEIPSDRWDTAASYDPEPNQPGKSYIRHGGFLNQVDSFDADLFNISPAELKCMDPQHRLLLEVTWEAIENAGYSLPEVQQTTTGIYVGIMNSDYVLRQVSELSSAPDDTGLNPHMVTGNSNSFLAGRISHSFNLNGPSLVVNTACSSSLVTVHMASQALRNGECDIALAGGVNVILDPLTNILLSQMSVIAPDGRCKTFDAAADGYSRGEGCGVVMLKRMSDAVADNDTILGVIRGSAINHDGKSPSGITVPNRESQETLLKNTLRVSDTDSLDISYIEAHGTGTTIGDSIELQALTNTLTKNRKEPLYIGSVKTNFGHLESAAGIAGLLKTVLALKHDQIPASLHFNNPNPLVPWNNIPVKVVTELTPWPQKRDNKRIAAVNSFGLSGTNSCVILEEAPLPSIPVIAPGSIDRPLHLLTLRAATKPALLDLKKRYAKYLTTSHEAFSDICYSAHTGRTQLPYRLTVVAQSAKEAVKALDVAEITQTKKRPKIAFLFTGQGAQYPNMGKALFNTQLVFRSALERCDAILRSYLEIPLLDVLYPDPNDTSHDADKKSDLIHQTCYAQPALFSFGYALCELWKSWGIKPDIVLGHSVGEYIAAWLAGVFSLEDGLKLIAARGRLMQALPENGKMASIQAPEKQVIAAINHLHVSDRVCIAGVNSPGSTVISGVSEAVEKAADYLRDNNSEVTFLEVSHAFHSQLMEPMLDEFLDIVNTVTFSRPAVKLVSNLTSQMIDGEITDPEYWVQQIRQPVRFSDGIQAVDKTGCKVFLEIGPKPVLSGLGRECIKSADTVFLSSLRKDQEWKFLLESLGSLFKLGVTIDWHGFEGKSVNSRKKVFLPTYAFQRRRYWALNDSNKVPLPTQSGKTPDSNNTQWHQGTINQLLAALGSSDNLTPEQVKLVPAIIDVLSELNPAANDQSHENSPQDSLKEILRKASKKNHADLINQAVAEKAKALLGFDKALELDVSLLDYSFDSIMSMELKAWCLRELEVDIEVSEILSESGIQGITQSIISRLSLFEEEATRTSDANEDSEEHITPVEPASPISAPLSHGQKALWFIYQSTPESSAYNVGLAFRIYSELDLDALQTAFELLTDRHQALRTHFVSQDGDPLQIIEPSQRIAFEVIDAKEWDEETLLKQTQAMHELPFDLEADPLMRVVVFSCNKNTRTNQHNHILLLTLHHIVCDSTSVWTLLSDLKAYYSAVRRSGDGLETPVLPKIDSSYVDYVSWQEQLLEGEQGNQLWEYWQQQLKGDLPFFDLHTDKPRPAIQRFEGASASATLSAGLTKQLRTFSVAHKTTLYNVLLAAYQILLHRHTAQTVILVGSPTAGQNRGRFSHVMGYFLNTLVMRADFDDDPEFDVFLKRVTDNSLNAIKHQDYPFSLLVERLNIRRDSSRAPLIQTRFSLQKAPPLLNGEVDIIQQAKWGDFLLEPYEFPSEEGQIDINMHVLEGSEKMKLVFKYNKDLFYKKTIETLMQHYITLLEDIIEHPAARVSQLRLISTNERQSLLKQSANESNDKALTSVHSRFADQAQQAPDLPAAIFGTEQLSYRELDQRANRLANYLQSHGLGRGSVIAIYLERSLALPVAILGILKSGATYLPLDPKTPTERLDFILRDSSANCLISEQKLLVNIDSHDFPDGMRVLYLEGNDPLLCEGNAETPSKLIGNDDVAYIIYTSGTTGKPKGVKVLHRGLSNYIDWLVSRFNSGNGSGSPVMSSIAFDLTVTSLYFPLVTGRAAFFLKEGNEVEELAALMANRELTLDRPLSLIKLTPTHLEMLQHIVPSEKLANAVETLIIGGEPLTQKHLAFWQQHAPDTTLVNHYGPTEATVGCCYHVIEGTAPIAEGSAEATTMVPIGKPMANTQLYILDKWQEPVPVGVAGELYIGGLGVGGGYINNTELTDEKFISNSFGEGRLFKTGDVVRRLTDGTIGFIGRNDSQVKIRGYRIELHEIQSLLSNHPHVKRNIVTVKESPEGDKRLIAYYIPVQDTESIGETADMLREYLAQSLPDYLIPAHFIPLPAFPLVANGKIDLKALPVPETQAGKVNISSPRDAVEMELAPIWESVLGINQIGIHDSFFDLGGNSLLAVRLVARVQRKFGQNIPIGSLLQNDSIAKFANCLRSEATDDTWSPLVAMQPAGARVPLFCIPGAGGNVIYFQNLSRELGKDQPFYGIQALGLDGKSRPHTKVEEMATFYIDAMKRVQPKGPYAICGHSLGGWVVYEMAQQLYRKGEEACFVGVIDTPMPISKRDDDHSDWDNAKWIVELCSRIQHLLAPDLNLSLETLRTIDEDQQLEFFKNHLDGVNLFPTGVGIEQLRNILELFKAQSRVVYTPKNFFPVNLTLFQTNTVCETAPAGDETWGWGQFAQVDIHKVPGEHLTVLAEPYVDVLAKAINHCLASVN